MSLAALGFRPRRLVGSTLYGVRHVPMTLVAFSSLFDTDAVVGGAGGICFVGYDPGGIRSVKLKRRIMSPPLLYVLKINSDEPASRNDF